MRASTAPRVDKLVVVSNHATKEARNAWREGLPIVIVLAGSTRLTVAYQITFWTDYGCRESSALNTPIAQKLHEHV